MKDIIVIAILIVIIGLAAFYVYKSKKSGKKCIGCPGGCSCCSKDAGKPCDCCFATTENKQD